MILMGSNVNGIQYNYTAQQLDVTGASNGNGAIINQKLTLTGIGSGSVQYTITPRVSNCYGQPKTALVQVIQKPLVFSSHQDTTICSGGTLNIQLSSDQMGAQLHYLSSGQAVTGHSSGTGNVINHTLHNLSSDTSIVTYRIFASTLGCHSDTSEITVRVLPQIHVVRQITDAHLCSNEMAEIYFVTQPQTVSVSWTVTSFNVNGASAGNGMAIQQQLFTTSITGKVIYHITGHLGSCTSELYNDTIYVTPRPDISYTPSGNPTICSGSAVSVWLHSLYTGCTYDWYPLPGNIQGGTTGNGPVISQILYNNTLFSDTIQYIATASLNGCPGDSVLIPVCVKPVPLLNMNPDSTVICSGNAVNIQINSNLPGTITSWTVQTQNVIGSYNGVGNLISQVLSTGNQQPGYAIYTATGILDGCVSEPVSAHVTVNACVGMEEYLTEQSAMLQNGFFQIVFSYTENASVMMIDFSGRLVYQNASPERITKIDLSGFRDGYYLIVISYGQSRMIKRIQIGGQ
jgi:hypothetical protein